jgi:hypothetical protein
MHPAGNFAAFALESRSVEDGMGTYKQIQEDIRARHDRAVKRCWIAHVRELNGLEVRQAHNRHDPYSRVHPCPERARPWIEESMRRLGILPAC